ncbi:MAG: DJ-1/PfpI family protein [Ignavibacteriales bacterium]|nr:DJ-1/PfpI family protein [Ignavibacteriales bacterium]
MKRNILIILPAKMFNEIEYTTIKNELEKSGFEVFIASDTQSLCVGKNGMKVQPDISIYNIHESNFLSIIFIGGSGVKNYWNNKELHNYANEFYRAGKLVTAICSAPVILARASLLNNIEAVCYPEDRVELEKEGAIYLDQPVVISENIITGRDANAAPDFANAIISKLNK